MSEQTIFANTGVQLLCFPLKQKIQNYNTWRSCRCGRNGEVKDFHFVQWLIDDKRLILAVDTTYAEDHEEDQGYFCKKSALTSEFPVSLEDLVGDDDQPIANLELKGKRKLGFTIRAAHTGDPIEVEMVIDFGNSRTGALLLETTGEGEKHCRMTPLELLDRYRLDAWDENGEYQFKSSNRWFSSRVQWCAAPYLPPPEVEVEIFETETESRGALSIFGGKPKTTKRYESTVPHTFQDFSMVRLGREAGELELTDSRSEGPTGVSSPKRYLWADNAAWLEGANWHMYDPHRRYGGKSYTVKLEGPLLQFVPQEEGKDEDKDEDPKAEHSQTPIKPRYAPRVLMVAALYELMCQAYTFINSAAYREKTGYPSRARLLSRIVLTYPTVMTKVEREILLKQAKKAAKIFDQTLGRCQGRSVKAELSVDEASAVHLTYLWTEVQKLGNWTKWFDLMGRRHRTAPIKPPEESTESDPKVLIACIDIGGGTSDLTISKYTLERGHGAKVVHGEILHQDGISWAGDQLVKELLECVILPSFIDTLDIEAPDVSLLFGAEKPGTNQSFRAERISWMNGIFVPLAEAYLASALPGAEKVELSHTNHDIVDPQVLDSLQKRLKDVNLNQDLNLRYEEKHLDLIVHKILRDVLYDFCDQIVSEECIQHEGGVDVVLLAGQPTKLKIVQELVRSFLPLHRSRIVPMHNYYAGNTYPFVNSQGRIEDPKSAVVVGAAIGLAAVDGDLKGFQYESEDHVVNRSYYWGYMEKDGEIPHDNLWFGKLNKLSGGEKRSAEDLMYQPNRVTKQRRIVVGRKSRSADNAQATPVYVLNIGGGDSKRGPIKVSAVYNRKEASGDQDETIAVDETKVKGSVGDDDAELDVNVFWKPHSLFNERYYLDTGALDNIRMRFLFPDDYPEEYYDD